MRVFFCSTIGLVVVFQIFEQQTVWYFTEREWPPTLEHESVVLLHQWFFVHRFKKTFEQQKVWYLTERELPPTLDNESDFVPLDNLAIHML